MLAFLLFLINGFTIKNDLFSILVFIVFAIFIGTIGMMNKRYKKKNSV
jgi:hypothetical protein